MASKNKIPVTVYFETRQELRRVKKAAALARQNTSAFIVFAALERATRQRVVEFPDRSEETTRNMKSF